MWAGKVMASVFWNAHGVLFIDFLEKGKTINSERYIGQLHQANEVDAATIRTLIRLF